jgi:hypothetical protein
VIRVYDESSNVVETHEHAGEFKEWLVGFTPDLDGAKIELKWSGPTRKQRNNEQS